MAENYRDKFSTVTTPEYWECECDEGFIHPNEEEGCSACQTWAEDAPDARVLDCLDHGLALSLTEGPEILPTIIACWREEQAQGENNG